MRRRLFAICLTLAAAIALVALPASAAAKKPAKKAAVPTITRVLPMRLGVGDTITVSGKNFNAKAKRNTVIFQGPGGRTAFAKPTKASKTKLTLIVPGAVTRLLSKNSGGVTVPTRFRLRVLAGSFSKFTSRRLSPVIVGAGDGSTGNGPSKGPPGSPGNPVCAGTDFDGDLLPNSVELELKTDPCVKDTDLDGIEDGYEFKSAVDLNDDDYQNPQTSLPFPGKRPYPNPLDPGDRDLDFDGDSLTDFEEQSLWYFTIGNGATRTLTPLTYSAGEKYSTSIRDANGRRQPTQAATGYDKQASFLNWATTNGYRSVYLKAAYVHDILGTTSPAGMYGLLDMNRDGVEAASNDLDASDFFFYWNSELTYFDLHPFNDGYLSDDERDEDADGLTNYDETHGRMVAEYWKSCYILEKPYPLPYAGTNPIDADSDGDGVLDGADDQDHDDIPNVMELSRNAASGKWDAVRPCKPVDSLPTPPALNHADVYGRVNPFNPCLPDNASRTCTLHPGLEGGAAPSDDSLDYAVLN